jgi:hypothetical protein
MPYRYSTDDSDASTIYDETPSKEEAYSFYSFMKKTTKNLKSSRDQLVLGVLGRVNVSLVSEKLIETIQASSVSSDVNPRFPYSRYPFYCYTN